MDKAVRIIVPVMIGAMMSHFAVSVAQAQAQVPRQQRAEAQRAAMRRLDYMVGDWEGEGWTVMNGERHTFRGGELIQRKLGGIALLVEGAFFSRPAGSEQETPSHTTLGVISYDPRTQTYRFRTWLARGMAGERELTLIADGWQWEIRYPKGVIRYVMKLTPAGEWFEIGERSEDEKAWQKFFEMRLRKKTVARNS